MSIVVLPFANLTGDPQQAYLADGLTAAVTADLSRIRDAFIVSPATAFAYKDKPVTVQQIGKELGVHFALQGGVLRNGTKIRINAQLADTTTNAQLWSESFDGDQGDRFALQDSVTTRIGNGIGREMVVVAARESETRKSDQRAADLMLRARALGTKPVGLRNGEERQALYRQVLSLEPNNAQAMAGLAAALFRPVDNGFINDWATAKKYVEEARDLALKARGIDPRVADIYLTLYWSARMAGDRKEAKRAAQNFGVAVAQESGQVQRIGARPFLRGCADASDRPPDQGHPLGSQKRQRRHSLEHGSRAVHGRRRRRCNTVVAEDNRRQP
jgi:TolB-like protein